MPPLDRTVALAEMDDVAMAVGQNLELDMMRTFNILFDEDAAVAEGGLGFPCTPPPCCRAVPHRTGRLAAPVLRRPHWP